MPRTVPREVDLGAEHNTDLLQIDLESGGRLRSRAMAMTLAYTIHLAATELMEIDSREISLSVAEIFHGSSWRFQLYDSAAGGSGHVAELMARKAELQIGRAHV